MYLPKNTSGGWLPAIWENYKDKWYLVAVLDTISSARNRGVTTYLRPGTNEHDAICMEEHSKIISERMACEGQVPMYFDTFEKAMFMMAL